MNNNKKKFSKYVLIAFLFIAFLSCKKDGATGPVGPTGVTGATGATGPAGQSGTVLKYKAGNIGGTASGTSIAGNQFSSNYNFTYYKDATDNSVYTDANGALNFTINRYDSLAQSYFKLTFQVSSGGVYSGQNLTLKLLTPGASASAFNYLGTTSSASTSSVDPASVTLHSYYTYQSSSMTFSNQTYNAATGAVSFDYTIQIWSGYNSSTNMATLTGTVNTTVNKGTLRTAASL